MDQLAPNPLLDNLFFLSAILIAIYNFICMRNGKKGTGYLLFVIFILLFSLFYRPGDGDFWGYLDIYQSKSLYMEPIYDWLMGIIPDNYILWRIVIWLPAAVFIYLVFKFIRIPSKIATVFFIMYGLWAYYYTRNALALSILYLGMVFLSRGINSGIKKYYVLFIVLAGISWFFHRSMPIYIALALIVPFIPLNKKLILALLIGFPVLYGVAYMIGFDLLTLFEQWTSEGRGIDYLERENVVSASNWKGLIQVVIHYAPIFYLYFIAFTKPIDKDDNDYTAFKLFLLLSFLITYVSFLFYGQGANAIQGRLYKSSMIPLSFVVAIYFKHYAHTKRCTYYLYLVAADYLFTLFVRFAL